MTEYLCTACYVIGTTKSKRCIIRTNNEGRLFCIGGGRREIDINKLIRHGYLQDITRIKVLFT